MGPIRPPIINPGIRAGQSAVANATRQVRQNGPGPNNQPPTEGEGEWEPFDEAGGDWGVILDGIARIEERQDEGAEWVSFDDVEGDGYRGSWFADDAMTEDEFSEADFPDFESPQEFSEGDFEGLDEGFNEPDPALIAQLERELSEAIALGRTLDTQVAIAQWQYWGVKGVTFVYVMAVGGWALDLAAAGSYGLAGAYAGGRVVASGIKAYNDPSKHPDKYHAHTQAWVMTEMAEVGAEIVGMSVGGEIGRHILGTAVEGGLEYVNADDELAAALQGRNNTLRRSVGKRPVQ